MRLRCTRYLWISLLFGQMLPLAGCTGDQVVVVPRDGSLGCNDAGCACPTGTRLCSGQCVDTGRDPNHCGLCDEACEDGERCAGGQCACRVGLTRCGAACVDTQSNADHCGVCDHSCSEEPSGEYCFGGTCSDEPCEGRSPTTEGCSPSESSCVLSAELASHPLHCGECGESCSADEVCVQGMCQGWYVPVSCGACPCDECGPNTCCANPGTTEPICVVGVSTCPLGL